MHLTSKLAAFALGLSLLGTLVSCGGGLAGDDLFITDPVLTSGYVDNLNRPLICDNRPTPMEFGFLYSGDLERVQASLVGVTKGTRQAINVTGTSISGGRGKVTFSLPTGTAPLGVGTGTLGQQSIVISPNVIGSSELEMQGFDSKGVGVMVTSNAVPVVDNCG